MVSPAALVDRHVEDERRQLADARAGLKSARQRVVQVEEALGSRERFAGQVRGPWTPVRNRVALNQTSSNPGSRSDSGS